MWETSSTPGYMDDGCPVLWNCSVIVRADSDPPCLNTIHTTNTSSTKVSDYREITCHDRVCITFNDLITVIQRLGYTWPLNTYCTQDAMPTCTVYALNMQHAIGRLTGGKILPIKMYDYSGLMQKNVTQRLQLTINLKNITEILNLSDMCCPI